MSNEYDPYYRLLGIPKEDQPPDHYRLLGIQRFEQDREIIDSFASRHMAHLQTITVGPEMKYAQALLNEISRARRCLLDPEKKASYDALLRQKDSPENSRQNEKPPSADRKGPPKTTRQKPPVAKPVRRRPNVQVAVNVQSQQQSPPVQRSQDLVQRHRESAKPRRSSLGLVVVATGIVIAAAAVAATAIFWHLRSPEETTHAEDQTVAVQRTPRTKPVQNPPESSRQDLSGETANAHVPPAATASVPTSRESHSKPKNVAVYVNFGGPEIDDAQRGAPWISSRSAEFEESMTVDGSNRTSREHSGLAGTIYDTCILSLSEFTAKVAPGTYRIKLHFCEISASNSRRRKFAVVVEGQEVIGDFRQLLNQHGIGVPFDHEIASIRVDDVLNVEFQKRADSDCTTIVNGIEFERLGD